MRFNRFLRTVSGSSSSSGLGRFLIEFLPEIVRAETVWCAFDSLFLAPQELVRFLRHMRLS
jgi:hypothetical protein